VHASKAARAAKRAGSTTLVAFFGDGSFGWFVDSELLPFAAHYESLRKGGKTQARRRCSTSHSAHSSAAR
jgi:hypothetical protein